MSEPELIKTVISIVNGIILLALTWFVGQRIAFQWNIRQKRRELQLTSLQQFYIAYGEFFAVWKLWNRLNRDVQTFDFITFETNFSLNQFIIEHEDSYRETERRVILRGIVGYWQGKTLVILPSLSTARS